VDGRQDARLRSVSDACALRMRMADAHGTDPRERCAHARGLE
jgi:hypothetical protein